MGVRQCSRARACQREEGRLLLAEMCAALPAVSSARDCTQSAT